MRHACVPAAAMRENLHEPDDAGQIAVPLLLVLLTFVLLVLGFAVDLTNVWVHRQEALTAADAACQAGAMDMNASTAGETYTSTTQGFTPGTAGDCKTAASPTPTICWYANANGFNGAGTTSAGTNEVSWSFPASVNGVTAGPGTNPFLKVSITEYVGTYLVGLLKGATYFPVTVTSTCGITQVAGNAPLVILNPSTTIGTAGGSTPGALDYSGGATINILGGPTRGIQVNSRSANAITYAQDQGKLNLSRGGPSYTGSDLGIVGSEPDIPGSGTQYGYEGGTSGTWRTNVIPVVDPFGSVPAPAGVKALTPTSTTNGTWVKTGTDGCPDTSTASGNGYNCIEFTPGYYPSGLSSYQGGNNYSTVIFTPGVYYFNGSVTFSGSTTVRVGKKSGTNQTQGLMFYFLSGELTISGNSGGNAGSGSTISPVPSTDLTCDGSSPPTNLGLGTSLYGNVLYGMCTANGTYVDSYGDTSDTLSSTGIRGMLLFSGHSQVASGTNMNTGSTPCVDMEGSGSLQFAGIIYCHNTAYNSQMILAGAGTTGTYMIGEIIVDKLQVKGSASINLALNPSQTGPSNKVTVVQ